MGCMLIAERKARIYRNNPGAIERTMIVPERNQPCRWWNMVIPMACLVGLRYVYLDLTPETAASSFEDRQDLGRLLDTMKWALSSGLFLYLLQGVDRTGKLQFSPYMFLKKARRRSNPDATADDDDDGDDFTNKPRVLVSLDQSIDVLLRTTGRAFPSIIGLIFVWGTASAMVDVGVDRLIARWIVGTQLQFLPTVTFVLATLLAMVLSNTLAVLKLLLPLVIVPAYESSGGDAQMVYAVVASVLSGTAAGLQLGPVSDTLILSSWSAGCQVRAHMVTQLFYIGTVIVVTILFGTLPTRVLPNAVCIGCGIAAILVFVGCVCKKTICESGKFDIVTETMLGCKFPEELKQLRLDTAAYFHRTYRPHVRTTEGDDAESGPTSLVDSDLDFDVEIVEEDVTNNHESVC